MADKCLQLCEKGNRGRAGCERCQVSPAQEKEFSFPLRKLVDMLLLRSSFNDYENRYHYRNLMCWNCQALNVLSIMVSSGIYEYIYLSD